MSENIIQTEYSDEMQKSYLDYSMSVITARAIPDLRDGLKPVQRRVLYDMNELNLGSNKPHRKSARIVGDTMGKFHPHGDSSIYETLVILSQNFKKSKALVDGHGNFGSIEGDAAAAMRYTEARLESFTENVYLQDVDKMVDFVPNYDDTEQEPEVLPVRIPNFLLNGSEGIAVGMSTSVPTHNLGEICDLCIEYIDNKFLSTKELLNYLPGPDFPTGGIIANKSELIDIYEKGYGKLKLRGKIEFEPAKKRSEKDRLIITEVPYTIIGAGIDKLLSDIATLIENKILVDVVDISNQSDKDNVRIVLDLKKDADIENIKNILYKKTKLEDTFGVNMLAIYNKKPEVVNLRKILEVFLEFQHKINRKKFEHLLEKEMLKKEIQDGLITAYNCIEVVVETFLGAKNAKDVKQCLIHGITDNIKFKTDKSKESASKFRFSEAQAGAIMNMKLQNLIAMEINTLIKENDKSKKDIEYYNKLLSSSKEMEKYIKKTIKSIKDEYGYERKTYITDAEEVKIKEESFKEEEYILTIDKFGYVKLLDKSVYEKSNQDIYDEYKYVFPIMNTDKLVLFGSKGNMYSIKTSDIPVLKLKDKGVPIDNLSKFNHSDEILIYAGSMKNIIAYNLIFITKSGNSKIVEGSEFDTNIRCIKATKLPEADELIHISPMIKDDFIMLISNQNYILKIRANDLPIMKKSSKGSLCMKLKDEEYITKAYNTSYDNLIIYKSNEIRPDSYRVSKLRSKGTKIKDL